MNLPCDNIINKGSKESNFTDSHTSRYGTIMCPVSKKKNLSEYTS